MCDTDMEIKVNIILRSSKRLRPKVNPFEIYKESAYGYRCAPFRVEGINNREEVKYRHTRKKGEKRDSRVGPKWGKTRKNTLKE